MSGAAFLAMSAWGGDELQRSGGRVFLELILAGLGFGLIIAPLSHAVLVLGGLQRRAVAGSLIVLARTVGMVVGLAALTAYGLGRFQRIFEARGCGSTQPTSLAQQIAALESCSKAALLEEYHELFLITAVICALAAVLALAGLRRSWLLHELPVAP